jgi:integrase
VVDALVKHKSPGDLVFSDPMGKSIHPNTLDHQFKRLVTKVGVPKIRSHALRHTSATLLLAAGEHPKVVQERLGHANMGITMDLFSHVTMSIQQQAAEKMDALFSSATNIQPKRLLS